MSELLGATVTLGLVWVALTVMVGKTRPGEALARIGLVVLLLLFAPLFVSMLKVLVVGPLVAAFWLSAGATLRLATGLVFLLAAIVVTAAIVSRLLVRRPNL